MSEAGVGQAIKALREELEAAIDDGADKRVRFGLGVVRLELTAAFTKLGNGKLGWKIIEIGGSLEDARTQKITVELTPQVRDETTGAYTTDFLVAGVIPAVTASSGVGTNGPGAAVRDQGDRTPVVPDPADD